MKANTLTPILLSIALLLQGCQEITSMVIPAIEEPMAMTPCDAPTMAKATQSYPFGIPGGNVIRLEKMAPEQIRAGEIFDYQIKVTNLTDNVLANIMVTDRIPDNMKIESAIPKYKMIGSRARWLLGSLDANESMMITISAVAQGKGQVTSCAQVTYDSPLCAQMNIVQPDLRLAKVAPEESLSCDRIPLRYLITNAGDGYACDIQIVDKLAKGLVTSDGKTEVTFSLDALAPGKSQEFKVMVDAMDTGKYMSRAVATSSTSGKAESNMPVTVVSKPILLIAEKTPDRQFIGRNIIYEFTVTNSGDGFANDTVLIASIPEGIEFKDANAGGVYTHSSPGKVTWKVATIEPHTSKTFRMTISSENAAMLTSTATVKAHCAETVSIMARTSIEGISAILLEVIDTADPVEVGQNETYIISVTNQGSAPGTNIEISCQMQDNMEYVSSSGPTMATVDGKKIRFEPLRLLAPKAKASWRVVIRSTGIGDVRFKVSMLSSELDSSVEETEATRFYR